LGDAVGTSFELAGCSSNDSNEGGNGKKGREAEVHVFNGRLFELDCWRGDGMLFADGELFYDLTLYTTERRVSSPTLCTLLHTAHSPSAHAGTKRSGVPTYLLFRQGKPTRRKKSYISWAVETYGCCGWLGMPYDHRSLVLGPMKTQ